MKNAFAFIALTFLVAGCGSSSNGSGGGENTDALVTYEIKGKNICSTDLQKFSGGSDEQVIQKMCDGLKDENLNKSCAHSHRKNIFQVHQCSGAWPHNEKGGRITSVMSKRYEYKINNCSTGIHIIVTDDDKILMRTYCQYLSDDKLNQNCASEKRAQEFSESECEKVLKEEL